MKQTTLTGAELAQIAGTRVALGAGIGLLLARRMSDEKRKGAGLALLIVGILSTIPIAIKVLGQNSGPVQTEIDVSRGEELEPAVR
jgi:hypothetical protein